MTEHYVTWRQLETVFRIYFDGGSHGENGYGSFEVHWNGFVKRSMRIEFLGREHHHNVTNNMAEFLALLASLKFLSTVKDREQYRVVISGDSQLVLNQLSGAFKCRVPHLVSLRDRCKNLLSGFSFTTEWRPRKFSVQRFGH